MMPSGELDRFLRHLSANPYVRLDDRTEMLAGRPVESIPEIELNGILRRYVAIAIDPAIFPDLPLRPTISVSAVGTTETHGLWELADPVTASIAARSAPLAFWADVGEQIGQWAAARVPRRQDTPRVLRQFVLNPLHQSHVVISQDVVFKLADLKAAYSVGNAKDRTARLPSHHSSGKNSEAFDALRQAAPRMAKVATSSAQLAALLQAWADPATRPAFSSLTPSERQGLCARVAEYAFSRRHGGVSTSMRSRVQAAGQTVAREHGIGTDGALRHMPARVAELAGVHARTVRRANRKED